ncbi:hypothetical protein TsFJ059_003405 [Trichoderma semiorbis]|uniref:DUF5672 domain-containing protein n=1 Tax=Trichoderma semiorbis TaxID=1491008 RepID=A0A9P8KVY7_9HYPO|nr:hypothetical protein TsFJ059_003405 [Trichoderma semiorbis]
MPNNNEYGQFLGNRLLACLWSFKRRRLAIILIAIILSIITLSHLLSSFDISLYIPHITIEFQEKKRISPYNTSKVALLIENRPIAILAPLMLHFISVVPPDWHFRFMGSPLSVASINRSVAIRHQVAAGKLDLTYIPENMSTNGQEEISQFLTTLWLYEAVLQPAEWLLVFQTDSMLCGNSRLNLNDYLEYDWVGAPWNPGGQWGGNGGLSLRRVSRIIDILRNQRRANDSEPEDVWLSERLAHHPGGKVANGSVSMTFSGEMHDGRTEQTINSSSTSSTPSIKNHADNDDHVAGVDDWRAGFYEPMGYHIGGSGSFLHSPIWGMPELREHMWKYCPEIKMTLAMDVAKYIPGNCGASWA